MKPLPFITSFLAISLAIASAQDASGPARPLDDLLTADAAWQMNTAQFEEKFKAMRFDWLSERKDQARFFGPGLSLWGGSIKLNEAIIEFSTEGSPAKLTFSIYNRGDAETLINSRDQFETRVNELRDAITKKVGVSPTERGKDKSSAVAAEGFVWTKAPSAYLLEYSYQREMKSRNIAFRAEFIRLRVANVGATGKGALAATSTAGTTTPVGRNSLTANVKRDEASGDVLIANVPMVDQGPKGYCAVATAERVFKYYGIPVDQHEMAQVADTTDGGGTSPDKMLAALTKLEGRMGVSVRAIEDFDFKKFMDRVGDYNKEAKRAKKPEVDASPRGNTIYINEIIGQMDGEILKVARTERDRSGYGKFQRTIAGLIDQGIPVMWSVSLGLLPEKEIPQAEGGHMRLIIGYNAKTSEALYSDSWGADHALKRMPLANAYTMTNGLYIMQPRAR
ncbi:MAG: C39 family peptidase [Verrucomicrobiota bacterium]